MRPRFSIRLVLVVAALLATASYVLFVRPANVAHRFVEAVNEQDFTAARSLLIDQDFWLFDDDSGDARKSVYRIYAEVVPREWPDIWSLQRRVLVRVMRRDDTGGQRVDWTEDIDMVAHISGMEVILTYDVFRPGP